MKTINKIDGILPRKSDIFLLDACVLLYVFYTSGGYRKNTVDRCSGLFTNIIKSNAKILIFPELLEEFFNRFLKLEFKLYLKKHNLPENSFDYKDFRKTQEFSDTVLELKELYANQLKPYGMFVNSELSSDHILSFLDSITELDMRDRIYCEIAKKFNAKIVTNDSDYWLSTVAGEIELYKL